MLTILSWRNVIPQPSAEEGFLICSSDNLFLVCSNLCSRNKSNLKSNLMKCLRSRKSLTHLCADLQPWLQTEDARGEYICSAEHRQTTHFINNNLFLVRSHLEMNYCCNITAIFFLHCIYFPSFTLCGDMTTTYIHNHTWTNRFADSKKNSSKI